MLQSQLRSLIARSVVSVLLVLLIATPALAERPTTKLLPVIPGDEETRSTPFIAWFQDLPSMGYVEEEYSVSGKANIYGYLDDVGEDPRVVVQTPDVPYTTRILVRRPADCMDKAGKCRRFNGTVYVEVLNATAG